MKKIHRAIRPAERPGEYFFYVIEYEGDGFQIMMENLTIHLISKGIVGNNILPPDMVNDPSSIFAAMNILVSDGVLDVVPPTFD